MSELWGVVYFESGRNRLPLKTEHMHYLCEALFCDSLMTNPQTESSLLPVSVQVVSWILFDTLSV